MDDQGGYLAYLNEQNAQLNKWFEDPTDILQRFEMSLRGMKVEEVYDEQAKKMFYRAIPNDMDEPKMNEIGIREVIGFIDTNILNRNVTLSDVKKDEVYRDAQSVVFRFHEMVAYNYRRWELKFEYIPMLCTTVENTCWFAFNRPVDGKNKVFIKGMVQEIIHRNEDITQRKQEGFTLPFLTPKKRDDDLR